MDETIVVVGANHAGTAAINTILDNHPEKTVIAFDRNSNISFLGCGMALWIGRQISRADGLFYSSKKLLEEKGARVHMDTEVTEIDFVNRVVYAESKNGQKFEQPYDKLILAAGSLPVRPNIPGIELENVQFVKLFQNAEDVVKKLEEPGIRKTAVVGAGYIGVELAEAFGRNGRDVLLIDSAETCLSGYYDREFCQIMADNLGKHGVVTAFGEKVIRLEGIGSVSRIVTDRNSYETDMVVFGIGFVPNTVLGKDRLPRFSNGAYLVNNKQETGVPGVYAIGDCATVFNNATQSTDYIALATNAVRSGIIAASNACGESLKSSGVQGSNGISIWGLHMLSTGITLGKAEALGYDAAVSDYEDWQKPLFIENGNHKVKIRIVYDKKSRRILGTQMCSDYDISMGIHLFSMAIAERVTIDKLKLFDLFFLPHFNQPYNYITMAALRAE